MLRVGCGNSVRNHRPQWALSPASRFQMVQVARSGDGLQRGALRIIGWERRVSSQGFKPWGDTSVSRMAHSMQRSQPTKAMGGIQWLCSELLLNSRPGSTADLAQAK